MGGAGDDSVTVHEVAPAAVTSTASGEPPSAVVGACPGQAMVSASVGAPVQLTWAEIGPPPGTAQIAEVVGGRRLPGPGSGGGVVVSGVPPEPSPADEVGEVDEVGVVVGVVDATGGAVAVVDEDGVRDTGLVLAVRVVAAVAVPVGDPGVLPPEGDGEGPFVVGTPSPVVLPVLPVVAVWVPGPPSPSGVPAPAPADRPEVRVLGSR